MRPVREITATEENFRLDPKGPYNIIRRDSIKPEPEGTIVLMPYRITGYDQDCDGSLMARLEAIDKDGKTVGGELDCVGLYPDSNLVVTLAELQELFE